MKEYYQMLLHYIIYRHNSIQIIIPEFLSRSNWNQAREKNDKNLAQVIREILIKHRGLTTNKR